VVKISLRGYWDDISTQGQRVRKQISQEFALFAKDDYKITRRLTLNLGLRWEYYGSPYIQGGFTSAFVGGGWGAFGATRTAQTTLEDFNADPFKYFLHPGNLYLTGYGSSTTNPLSCQRGVQQNGNPLLPVSTCDPASLAQVEFVGPGSVNPNKTAIPQNFGNFGPAIGFAYTLPWFGEGKTTIRGGYQQTFGSAGANRSALSGGHGSDPC
jgi:outer membrane receptor protein involved in Fe transport